MLAPFQTPKEFRIEGVASRLLQIRTPVKYELKQIHNQFLAVYN